MGLDVLDKFWLAPDNIIQSLTVAIIWTYVGYYMTILLAGIDKNSDYIFRSRHFRWCFGMEDVFHRYTSNDLGCVCLALVLWVIGSLKYLT